MRETEVLGYGGVSSEARPPGFSPQSVLYSPALGAEPSASSSVTELLMGQSHSLQAGAPRKAAGVTGSKLEGLRMGLGAMV